MKFLQSKILMFSLPGLYAARQFKSWIANELPNEPPPFFFFLPWARLKWAHHDLKSVTVCARDKIKNAFEKKRS